MVIGLQVDLQGVGAVQAELDRLIQRGHDLPRAHRMIGAVMESRVNMRFDTKADPLGHPWAAHSAASIGAYRARDTNKRGQHRQRGSLLERSGRMHQALGYAFDALAATVGFGVPYAAFHEFGTRHMVRRGLLMADPLAGTLSPGDEDAIINTLIKHFAN